MQIPVVNYSCRVGREVASKVDRLHVVCPRLVRSATNALILSSNNSMPKKEAVLLSDTQVKSRCRQVEQTGSKAAMVQQVKVTVVQQTFKENYIKIFAENNSFEKQWGTVQKCRPVVFYVDKIYEIGEKNGIIFGSHISRFVLSRFIWSLPFMFIFVKRTEIFNNFAHTSSCIINVPLIPNIKKTENLHFLQRPRENNESEVFAFIMRVIFHINCV